MARTALVETLCAAGFQVGPAPTDTCEQCPHVWGNHLLVAPESLFEGGYSVCPFEGCECRTTWDVRATIDPDGYSDIDRPL